MSLSTEREMQLAGFPGADLVSPDGTARAPLQRDLRRAKSSKDMAFFPVPPAELDKKRTLRVRMECEIFLNPTTIVVPATVGPPVHFDEFGGIDVRVTRVTGEKIE